MNSSCISIKLYLNNVRYNLINWPSLCSFVWILSCCRQSPLERDIRKNNLDYEWHRCKEKFSINLKKCPKCSQITIYGTGKKFLDIYPIITIG